MKYSRLFERFRPKIITGIALARSCGRPVGSDKTQIALRVDNNVLNAFKKSGKGWQTRMNDALKEWLSQYPDLSRV